MDNPKNILLQALTIIGFPDEKKDDFIAKFAEVANKQFVSDLLNTLPEDEQKSLLDRLSEETDQEKISSVLQENFSKEVIEQTLRQSTEKVFSNYLETIMPDLSEEKKLELAQYFKTISEE